VVVRGEFSGVETGRCGLVLRRLVGGCGDVGVDQISGGAESGVDLIAIARMVK
jgi:hypothetical protein